MSHQKRRRKTLKTKARAAVRRQKRSFWRKIRAFLIRILLIVLLLLAGYAGFDYYQNHNLERTGQLLTAICEKAGAIPEQADALVRKGRRYFLQLIGAYRTNEGLFSIDDIPPYSGEPYIVLNHNIPDFNDDERTSDAFEYYSDLDDLGRCGLTEAMVTRELMPTESRGEIGMVKPTGWHTVKYNCITDRYLYNRCHLIAFELAGENANEKNLITGTRYMNVSGMLPFENLVAQYVRKTRDRVIYRVTPVFVGDELVARGVHMEAESIGSDKIRFNVFVYNVQPGIGIDYSNGNSWQES